LSRATWLREVDVAILCAAAAGRSGRFEKSAAVVALQLLRPGAELLRRWVGLHGPSAGHAGADVPTELAAGAN
jgi:hypothetical protein